jgi:hypothetical protein
LHPSAGKDGKHIANLDAVVQCPDRFIIGVHSSGAACDADFDSMRKSVDEVVLPCPLFEGKPVQLALMAEHADEQAKSRLLAECKKRNVIFYYRNGNNVSRVQCKAMRSLRI